MILRFFFRLRQLLFAYLRDSKPFSPLTSLRSGSTPLTRLICPLTRCSQAARSRSLKVPCRHLGNAQKSYKRAIFFSPLLQMPRHNCRLCSAPLRAAEGHSACVFHAWALPMEDGMSPLCGHESGLSALKSSQVVWPPLARRTSSLFQLQQIKIVRAQLVPVVFFRWLSR